MVVLTVTLFLVRNSPMRYASDACLLGLGLIARKKIPVICEKSNVSTYALEEEESTQTFCVVGRRYNPNAASFIAPDSLTRVAR